MTIFSQLQKSFSVYLYVQIHTIIRVCECHHDSSLLSHTDILRMWPLCIYSVRTIPDRGVFSEATYLSLEMPRFCGSHSFNQEEYADGQTSEHTRLFTCKIRGKRSRWSANTRNQKSRNENKSDRESIPSRLPESALSLDMGGDGNKSEDEPSAGRKKHEVDWACRTRTREARSSAWISESDVPVTDLFLRGFRILSNSSPFAAKSERYWLIIRRGSKIWEEQDRICVPVFIDSSRYFVREKLYEPLVHLAVQRRATSLAR